MSHEDLLHARPVLVVAGGGARGAYAAGCLTRLAELGLRPTEYSGTSIGALTVGVLAGSESFGAGVDKACRFWDMLSKKSPLGSHRPDAVARALLSCADGAAIFDDTPIADAVKDFVNLSCIASSAPTWVTVSEVLSPKNRLLLTLVSNDLRPHWINLQTLPRHQIHDYLLASAAIPFALSSRQIDGMTLVDGGLVDNIPVLPVVLGRPGLIIVIKLQHGSAWWRGGFPDQAILEISPSEPVQQGDGILPWMESLLDFSPSKIAYLRNMGYKDTERILRSFGGWHSLMRTREEEQRELIDSTRKMIDAAKRTLGDP
ncbi:patatin-like phospholipase family protein [Ideonella sp. 4Y16]|uniref:Patatin-like phospholipase family protein n=1 Tax=Ideonella alba TaxID=2824118 RepID=A0A940YED0_9BURK|nr:patatin-like phospholipase family protein [Ideonella alba]MBQ0933576.1 patatin-like phospholipase family protein [Ideonella alba]MBQ0946208.1 patatin-like phospholipase family protein [Ideonella alba]